MNKNDVYVWSLQDYVKMVKRRKFWIMVPFVTILGLATMLAFVLPATYQSKAIILIEEQEVPMDFVRSTITSYAAQQVQVISQRVLTLENISAIIDKFYLYKQQELTSDTPLNFEFADKFRGNMNLELISADVIDPRSGRPTEATIAFTLAFDDPVPATAQKVARELVTLFLSENQMDRAAQASSTADFLSAEAEQINAELLNMEQQLANFKSANEGALPEQYGFNLDMLERTHREISENKLRSQAVAKRKIELSSTMSQLSPSAPVILASGELVLSDVDRLRALETDYRRKAAIYRPNHPDVVRLEREISALQAELGIVTDVGDLRRQLSEQEQHLAELSSRYNDNHHEVQSTRRVIAQLKENIRTTGGGSNAGSAPVPDNPAYLALQTELYILEAETSSLGGREKELTEKVAYYEDLLKRTPEVEKEYLALLRDYENATSEYKSIKANQRDALTSQNLEQEQKGQRFTVVEPPALPYEPVSPNRPAVIFLGFIVAAGLAFGMALIREFMDDSIRGVPQLTVLLGQAPLVAIPYINNEVDVAEGRRAWMISVASVVGCLLLFYFLQRAFFQL